MDKAPRKKEKRPVKRGALLLLLLGIALVLGAAAYFLRPQTQLPPPPETPDKEKLLSRPAEEIAQLRVTDREGGGYRLVRGENGLAVEGMEDTPLRAEAMEEIALMASDMEAEQTAWEEAAAAPLSDYGLEPPALRLEITYADGEEKTVLLGDLTLEETPQRYARLVGDARVFTVLEAECEIFFREKDYFRDFAQPRLDPSLLDRIQISGNFSLDLRYTPSGWLMEAPHRYPAAPARMSVLLEKIGAMAFEACLGDAGNLALWDYGLDAPALTVTLKRAASVIQGETVDGESVSLDVPAGEYTLLLGRETGQSGVYLLWEGKVFKASNFLLGFWKELNADELLLQQPVNFQVNDLKSVSFSAGDRAEAYRVEMVESVTENNRIATDEYGRVLYECQVTRVPGGGSVEQEAFLNWYAGLASLRAGGRLPEGYQPQGEAEARLVLESNSITREILLYPYDGLHDVLSVNGTALHYVQKNWIEKALEMLP